MFGLFKKAKVTRKSDEQLNKTETKWFKGQKVKLRLEQLPAVLIKKIIEVINQIELTIKLGSKKHLCQYQMLKKNKCL